MPQKQNPVLSVLVRSAALQAPGQAAQLHLAAANFNDERPDGAWHSEWPALRQLLRLGLGAAGQLRELAEGLQVFPGRHAPQPGPVRPAAAQRRPSRPPSHRSWLDSQGTAADGKQQLQAVVDQTLQVPAAEQAATYRRLLRDAVPPALLSDARLEELLDPANYLGQAAEISRRILAAYPDYSARVSDTDAGPPPLPIPELNGASRG